MMRIYSWMKAAAYDETNNAVSLTDRQRRIYDGCFEANRDGKTRAFPQEKLGNPIHIVITNQDNKEAKDLMQMAKDVFGELKEID